MVLAIKFWFKVDNNFTIMSWEDLLIEVHVPSQESELSCISVLEVAIFYDCSVWFNCSDGAVIFLTHYGFLLTNIRQSHGAKSGTDLRVKQ